jgi:hypothetical protein
MNDNLMKNFEARMANKKASQPKLHDFTAEFKIGIKAVDEETAQQTVDIISKHLESFTDIASAKGVLK